MSKIREDIKTANSVVRTALMLAVVGVVGYGVYLGYENFVRPKIAAQLELAKAKKNLEKVSLELNSALKEVEVQKETIIVLEKEKERLETAMRLLKVDHRLARIKVLEVGTDSKIDRAYTKVEFQEVSKDGKPLGKGKVFRLSGEKIYVDCWVVKFDDKYVEESDLHRATSLCIFKSIYGNIDGPENGISLEEENARPVAYENGYQVSDFEKKIWEDFWKFANEPKLGKEMGIRANHGQVNYVLAEEGKVYQIDLRASDGLTIRSINPEPEITKDTSPRG